MQLSRLFATSCKDSLQKQSKHKDLPCAGSQITQTVACISAVGLVIASAGFGAVFAFTVGVQHGPLLAGLTIVMAIALELAKPLAVSASFTAFRSWSIVRGVALSVLAVVAIGYSLTAELQLVASSRGDLVAQREAAIEGDDRRESVKQARSELASLAPSRTAAEVQADIARLLATNPKAGDCRSMDNATARYVCPKIASLNGEAARTKRRGELQARIDKATGAAQSIGTIKNADPGSAALATFLATLGINVSAGRLSDWLVLVPVVALELGAALALLLVQSVSAGTRTGQNGEQKPAVSGQDAAVQADTKTPASPGDPAPTPTKKRTRGKPRKRTRGKGGKGSGGGGQSGKRHLGSVVDLLKARGGQIKGGQRGIGRKLGLSKSRTNELLHELAAAGKVRLDTSRAGTMVTLATA